MGFLVIEVDDFLQNYNNFLNHSQKLKFSKNWSLEELEKYIKDPINYSMLMLDFDFADALILGSSTSTSDVARSGLRFIGIKESSSCLSSLFLMISPSQDRFFSYADCAIIPEPSEYQLADIAYDTAINHGLLTGESPKVAFLSFSTNSSASHYRVDKVKRAINLFSKKYSSIEHENVELQFDSAICPDIAIAKYSKSALKGSANVLIYPNLDAGNIAYKITERIGNYSAIGPLLQGFNKPVHDLSRGCNVDDIVDVSIIAAYQGSISANI
jgi:phosphate acetyltransferase